MSAELEIALQRAKEDATRFASTYVASIGEAKAIVNVCFSLCRAELEKGLMPEDLKTGSDSQSWLPYSRRQPGRR